MSLRSKIALVLFVGVAAFTCVDHVLYMKNFEARFDALDQEDVDLLVDGIRNDLDAVLHRLDRTGERLAQGTQLANEGNQPVPESWTRLEQAAPDPSIDMVVAIDQEGWVKMHRLFDPETGERIELRELPNERMALHHPLRRSSREEGLPRGLWVTEHGALLVSVIEGPVVQGQTCRLAVGKFLDRVLLDTLSKSSGVRVQTLLANGVELTDKENDLLYGAEWAGDSVTEVTDSGPLRAWIRLDDLGDTPAALLRLDVPHRHAQLWAELRQYDVTSTLALILLFPLVVLLLLQWIVTGPLAKLTTHTTHISKTDDTSSRLEFKRSDEIGILASGFDSMLDKLDASRAEVVRTARMAGMSEVSVGVMHNVGNTLNNLSTSAGMTRQHLAEMSVQDDLRAVSKAIDENKGHLDHYLQQDSQGRHLMKFLSAIIEELDSKVGEATGELNSLSTGVEHIEHLLHSLASSTAHVDVVERVDIASQVDSVLELCLRSDGNEEIRIDRNYSDLNPVLVDRHKLMEVLVHLVQNASAAMSHLPSPQRHMCIGITHDEGNIQIAVADNGSGIPVDLQARIFTAGYTTDPERKGLGLHFAATSAGELGGSLAVGSEGPGFGATFTLRLPAEQPSVDPAQAA